MWNNSIQAFDWSEREAEVDLVLIKTFFLFLWKLYWKNTCWYLIVLPMSVLYLLISIFLKVLLSTSFIGFLGLPCLIFFLILCIYLTCISVKNDNKTIKHQYWIAYEPHDVPFIIRKEGFVSKQGQLQLRFHFKM